VEMEVIIEESTHQSKHQQSPNQSVSNLSINQSPANLSTNQSKNTTNRPISQHQSPN